MRWLRRLLVKMRGPAEYEGEVEPYLTEREIGGRLYTEEICARSFEEAEAVTARMGGRVLGVYGAKVCHRCGLSAEVKSKLSPNEWPEDIDA